MHGPAERDAEKQLTLPSLHAVIMDGRSLLVCCECNHYLDKDGRSAHPTSAANFEKLRDALRPSDELFAAAAKDGWTKSGTEFPTRWLCPLCSRKRA